MTLIIMYVMIIQNTEQSNINILSDIFPLIPRVELQKALDVYGLIEAIDVLTKYDGKVCIMH